MEETVWDSLISANKKAELKYRNVHPTLKLCLGSGKRKSRKTLIPPRPSTAPTLREVIHRPEPEYRFLSIPDVTFLHRTDHTVTSEFASVNYPNGRVTVFDPSGKVVNTFGPKDNENPTTLFGITSLHNDDVAICTGDGISIWSVDGRLVSHFTDNEVTNCCHLTLMTDGLLATTCLTDANNKCVSIWDSRNGKVVTQFGSRPEIIELNPLKRKQRILIRNSDIRLPWFVTSDSKRNVYISDRNAQCIKVFDSRTGKFLRRFDSAGVNARCRKGSFMPQGICVDEDDNVFVADQVSNSIVIFDRHGEVVRDLKPKLDHDNCELWSLALSNMPSPTKTRRNKSVSPSRKLALSFSNRKPRAQVFDLSFCRHYSVGF